MLEKTHAIALHSIRYGDNSLIVYLYTKGFGRLTLMVNGAFSRGRSTKKAVFFQSLNQLNIVFYKGNSYGMGRLKEVSPSLTFKTSPYNPTKRAIALFIGEVIYRTIREEESNHSLFNFLERSIQTLDKQEKATANFHLLFLAHLSKYVGFYPSGNYAESTPFFDIKNGCFVQEEPKHPLFFSPTYGQLLSKLIETEIEQCQSLAIKGDQRSEFLDLMLKFLAFHMGTQHEIKSLPILSQVFS